MSNFIYSSLRRTHATSGLRPRIRKARSKGRTVKLRRCRRSRLPIRILTTIGEHGSILTGLTLFGACLAGGRRLRRREIIALRLPSGQRVKARVRWRLGSRCGITFMAPVADFARLLAEGSGAILPISPRRRPAARRLLPQVTRAADTVWARLSSLSLF